MKIRASLYRRGIFRVTKVDVPVISIGNLTMGGSGKTPVVQFVARLLQERGCRPAVISRGYGGSAKEPVNLVSDGKQVFLDASAAGDEPRFLADTLPGVPVLTGKARKLPAARAVELDADVLILDDGFQHMSLARDLDLVLFNADFLAGNSTVFPGGDLREPVKALNRCHGFVMTGISGRNRERADQFTELLQNHFPDHPVFMADYKPVSFLGRNSKGMFEKKSLEELARMKLFGFSGIAHPENFEETLTELDCSLAGFRSFKDHHKYSDEDISDIFCQANEQGADACITTEKDMVKLPGLNNSKMPLFALRMEVRISNDFKRFLFEKVGGCCGGVSV